MKESRLFHIVNVYILAFIIFFCEETYGFNPQIEDGMKVYSNGFTYIIINTEYHMAEIYDMDCDPFHPVLSRTFCRGSFHLKHIQNGFYSIVNKELPGEKCIEHMEVSCVPDNSGYVTTSFKLGNCKENYVVMAKSIRTDTIYSMVYPNEKDMPLPIDKCGYEFSIMPSSSKEISMDGIIYGFSPVMKYLNLRNVRHDFFSSGGTVEISLPLFEDKIFDLWCIDGDIIYINKQILNEKIIWHGKEFSLSERIPQIFKF